MNRLTSFNAALAFTCFALTAAAQNAPSGLSPGIQVVPFQARPLPLSDMRLTGGPLGHAQELDAKYLLELEPDRMLYWLRVRAGLQGKADGGYGGWDAGATRQLTGHIAGHYLSAISYMYAATGNPEFKRRVDYMVNELKEIQDKQGDGYIGALMASPPRGGGPRRNGGASTNNLATNAMAPASASTNTTSGGGGAGGSGGGRRGRGEVLDGKGRFEAIARGTIQSGGFDLNGMWSPWYVEHKIFAGLRDAYHYTGNRTALEVEIKFAGWTESIVGKLTEAQLQGAPRTNGMRGMAGMSDTNGMPGMAAMRDTNAARRTPGMLDTEFGGMNEVLADLYHDTGNPRWLAVSDKFEHKSIVNPLAQHTDILGGKHGNTLVPKMIGELSRYVYTGNKTDGDAARFFWDQVVYHHSYATGGHGHDEYFDAPDKLSNHVDGRDDESCNVYNMLKMTRQLFALQPDVRYADFMERALFNHVLGSIDPKDGRTCYMVPVGRGVTHEYQDMFDSFTCCVGSGMESHALHGDGIFYETRLPKETRLWVNFYTPSTADWKKEQVKLDLDTTFPEGETASLKVTVQGKGFLWFAPVRKFTLALRRPAWAGQNFSVTVNGQPVKNPGRPGSYVEINRSWKTGDTVALALPKQLHEEPLPDNPRRVALMWGPLVLAGDLGPETRGRGRGASNNVPVLVSAEMPMTNWLKPIVDKPGGFESVGVGHNRDVQLAPFYRLHERTYAVYWDTFTPQEWNQQSPEFAAQAAREEKLKLATVGFAQPGQMQAERDANEQASSPEESTAEETMGHFGRRGTKWFSFDLAVDPAHPMTLICTYYADEWRKRTANVLVDGQKVGDQTIEARGEPKFYDVEYKIPAALVEGKKKVTVRFEATGENEIGAVYGLRTIRADMDK